MNIKIHKILNNNVIVILDKLGNEKIIMGRGLGFKKTEGDFVDPSLIEKQFSLNKQDFSSKFTEILSDIPIEVIAVTDIIINYAKSVIGENLQDSIYISLSDHVHFAIERHKQGFDIPNSFIWEIQKFYPQAYQIGKYALDMIKQRLGVELFEDEAGFIAFHIVNAQLNVTIPNVVVMTKIVKEILNIVKSFFQLEYDEDSLVYQRFVTHLKFFSQRLLNRNATINENLPLYEVIKKKCHDSYLCTKQIDLYLIKQYQYSLTDDESLYLTIHIERLKNELQKQSFLHDV